MLDLTKDFKTEIQKLFKETTISEDISSQNTRIALPLVFEYYKKYGPLFYDNEIVQYTIIAHTLYEDLIKIHPNLSHDEFFTEKSNTIEHKRAILSLITYVSTIYFTLGKAIIHLLKNSNMNLDDYKIDFLKRVRQTRNKVFEHNTDPNGFRLVIKPLNELIVNTDMGIDIDIYGNEELKGQSAIGFIDFKNDVVTSLNYLYEYISNIVYKKI